MVAAGPVADGTRALAGATSRAVARVSGRPVGRSRQSHRRPPGASQGCRQPRLPGQSHVRVSGHCPAGRGCSGSRRRGPHRDRPTRSWCRGPGGGRHLGPGGSRGHGPSAMRGRCPSSSRDRGPTGGRRSGPSRRPVGEGDVRIRPVGERARGAVYIVLKPPSGTALLEVPAQDIKSARNQALAVIAAKRSVAGRDRPDQLRVPRGDV
jgi:hypothetical protein